MVSKLDAYAFVSLKFSLCWFVVRKKHCLFAEKYYWSSAEEQAYVVWPYIMLRRQITVVERSTDQMMELYKDFIIYRWIQMVKA
jgi:hypothetical protein